MLKISKTGSQGQSYKWFCINLSNSQTTSHKHYQENNDNQQNPVKFWQNSDQWFPFIRELDQWNREKHTEV